MEIHAAMGVGGAYFIFRELSFSYPEARLCGVRIVKENTVSEELDTELRQSASAPDLHLVGNDLYLILNDGVLELTKWRN
ncbi:hypothetical protein MCEMIE11_01595 [Burkholderiales bacterium]